MRCVTVLDGLPKVDNIALKQSNLPDELTGIVCRDSSIVAAAKFLTNFSSALEKKRNLFFSPAQTVAVSEDMVSSNFLSFSSSLTYQSFIWAANFLLQRPIRLSIIVDIDEMKTTSRTLSISQLDDLTLLLSWTKDGPLLVCTATKLVLSPKNHNPFHAPHFNKIERDLLCALYGVYQKRGTTSSYLIFAFFSTAPHTNDTTTSSKKIRCSKPCAFKRRSSTPKH